tara:strand:+ start:878 stop:1408 length:531 start_codon:yes stop_codon:yes gene_type:complete
MRKCRKCDVTLVAGENIPPSYIRKKDWICRPCASKGRTSRDTPEKRSEYNKRYRKANAEKIAEYRKANAEKEKARQAKYRKANAEKIRADVKAYAKANPGKRAANQAKRRALIKKQTPSWYCHATVTEIYETAAEFGYQVDHIVPLSKGGLHSHENLQLLTPAENQSKSDNDCWIN